MLLLVLNVVYYKQIPAAQVARDHRQKQNMGWASDWLKRYREERIEGLKDRSKSSKPPDIPEEIVYQIKNELASSKQGWRTTKQVEDLIVRKSGGGIRYLHSHIQTYAQMGIQTEGTKTGTCKHSNKRRERTF